MEPHFTSSEPLPGFAVEIRRRLQDDIDELGSLLDRDLTLGNRASGGFAEASTSSVREVRLAATPSGNLMSAALGATGTPTGPRWTSRREHLFERPAFRQDVGYPTLGLNKGRMTPA